MAQYNDFLNTPGVTVRSAEDVEAEMKEEHEKKLGINQPEEIPEPEYDALVRHVLERFELFANARRESNIEQDMIDDLYAVSGKYRESDLAEIAGSNVFMNITSTKQRAGKAWIKDIIKPANANTFEITTSKTEDIPPAMKEMIYEAFLEDEERLKKEIIDRYEKMSNPEPKPQQQPQSVQPQPGQPTQPVPVQPQKEEERPPSALIVSKQLKEISKLRRDVEESIVNEIHKVANHDVRKLNRAVEDELREGGFEDTLDQFIDDFTTFPTAIMKGPIVTTAQRIEWVNGDPVEVTTEVFKDYRCNPLDCYPSPGAQSLYDGDFIEHIRSTPKELSGFAKVDGGGYKNEALVKVLDTSPGQPFWLSSDIEEDKARIEKRGSQTYANDGVYHGLHFWGSCKASLLISWGLVDPELILRKPWEEIEVEIILIGTEIVKCRLNKDPLQRRPYYAASFHQRSGSFWGRSLPSLMKDSQGVCNAAARALVDNMGMSSGPQMSILVDRLADDGDIEEQEALKIWQFRSDPQGNGGKPIEYFISPSNAKELLAVYDAFEQKADDVTGIPKYAYGNEKTAGAGTTASGLSMLLESATKGIKASVMAIAKGVIVPRVEYQSYMHLLKLRDENDPFKFNGDLRVVVKAVEHITIKAAQQQLRKELLQVTSNPSDLKIMGYEGRGMLLREIFADLGISEDVLPDRLELKEIQAKEEWNEQRQQDAQAQQGNKSVEATKEQIAGQERMHKLTVELQREKLEFDKKKQQDETAISNMKVQQRNEESVRRESSRLEDTTMKLTSDNQKADKALATTIALEAQKMAKEEAKNYEAE